ncbi:acyl-CoA synthetase family member 3 [Tropilaelaps mercedesae]|uniref:Acyl-CoA synthetase family member 3 n=1 Tax=Tropilaelaps mercedesae TaxID=418985 RepID=A0A1V9XFI5_9ACAR|nr:acyl-CoA synthetase family member 3 [Tropilaelaps mercedesae]
MRSCLTKCRPFSRLLSRHKFSPSVSVLKAWDIDGYKGLSTQYHQGFPAVYEPVLVRIANRLAQQQAQDETSTGSTRVPTITDEFGVHTYTDLLSRALRLSHRLQAVLDDSSTDAGVTLLLPNDSRYVVCQWAAWLSGAFVVPLHRRLPPKMIECHLRDSGSSVLMTADELSSMVDGLDKELMEHVRVVSLNCDGSDQLPEPEHANLSAMQMKPAIIRQHFKKCKRRPAQIIYTSGTTGSPKGVVITHSALDAQANSVAHDWLLGPEDHLLHHLPLHHTHGILNGLLAPLLAGSSVQMLPHFDPEQVWRILLSEDNPVNVMLAVPTMYAQLVLFAREKLWERREEIHDFLKLKLRLCTCGSAPLSLQLLRDWADLTGHVMLERYGMTEFGMGLGGDVVDPALRQPGAVGRPFSGLTVRIAERDGYSKTRYRTLAHLTKHSTTINADSRGKIVGELLVKGPQMFSHYHQRPDESKEAFTKDGWFRTGDIAELVMHANRHVVKILGRKTMDFIKCGGYKVSALDVENELEAVPGVAESAVFGIPDITWGERVVAVVVAADAPSSYRLEEKIKEHCRNTLPPTSIPSEITLVSQLPRNVMGKIDKNSLRNGHLLRSRNL